MSSTFAVAQYFILGFIKATSEKELRIVIGNRLGLAAFHKLIWVIHCTLTVILGLVILQVVLFSHYNSIAVTAATTISYVIAFILMALLSYNFFLWFNRNRSTRRSDLTVFLYALSSAALAMNIAIALVMIYEISQYKPEIVYPRVSQMSVTGTLDIELNFLYTITSILGFVLMWSATAIVLRSHSHRIGQVKYWFLVSIPLVYFIGQFLTLFLSQLTYIVALYSIPFTLLFVFTKPAGGILFGTAFLTIAKSSVHHESIIRDYLTLAAFGVMLFFVSTQNTVAQLAYPPFGLIGALFVGLSAYLMFLGLYSSAISVANDAKLRQSIRNSAAKESELLDSIGTAQMEQELQKRVLKIVKEHSESMVEETGVQPSLGEEDIKEYLDMVVNEIKRTKT